MILQLFLIFFIKAYVVGTQHIYIIIFYMKMSTHNICLYKEVDNKYTGCNQKTMALLDCGSQWYVW